MLGTIARYYGYAFGAAPVTVGVTTAVVVNDGLDMIGMAPLGLSLTGTAMDIFASLFESLFLLLLLGGVVAYVTRDRWLKIPAINLSLPKAQSG